MTDEENTEDESFLSMLTVDFKEDPLVIGGLALLGVAAFISLVVKEAQVKAVETATVTP